MEEFQDDALREISRHLPCVADRDDAADVCRRWRAALSEPLPDPPLPRQLPWLLLPSADSTRACCLFCGTGNDACVIRHKLTATHGARCFGSYNGAWVFLARDQIRRHAVVNIRDHCPNRDARFLYLPDALATGLNHGQRDMVILAATLSCSPDNQNCIGAGIVMQWQFIAGQRQVAFWRMGDPVAMALDADDMCDASFEVEDVLFHDGSFRFLTQGAHIRVCTPVVNQTGGLQSISSSLCLFQGREQQSQLVPARYLVQSRGSLLMVARYATQYSRQLPTNGFKVYEMMEKPVSKDGTSRVEYTWRELKCLGGRMLFVGRGCSRSYDVAKYPWSGIEGVYFADDSAFNDTAMLLRGADDKKYPCSDNGLWSESGTPKVRRCYPVQGPSKTSSPIWLLP
ncbi:hypothetical protein SEVIR_9G211700v4 [Setaria viridis]|uniref:KIB1-4 beta-propeller domain-containing protein n=1 Tax=Setaria viridis TaxID=4556 RepID=A0A4U6SW77_SETVI|nr:uncharacterized protein LOC117840975 [Setaria viridis]XP_034577417.1 uncharacterized protein LOC117840975 [Setaria viridis]XP_034577418.1 uncharacterized protein LOC117840975 [Setaria viridis]XP_034577420.1 uncharacterized protein LOC117840975 [Setaria viridis]XP_034577421.1 uncharacterized protein LOC117840975 [Setaria viridis]XP_034577422.1 uncharacterized protein LOC117840975 [Setaria viridis]XP_034577423.1 uncharacterized protein LOC117840975 [Setaria viridis]XP_034577424.1 uncharacte